MNFHRKKLLRAEGLIVTYRYRGVFPHPSDPAKSPLSRVLLKTPTITLEELKKCEPHLNIEILSIEPDPIPQESVLEDLVTGAMTGVVQITEAVAKMAPEQREQHFKHIKNLLDAFDPDECKKEEKSSDIWDIKT
jgi:hypothetical protein